MNRYILKMTHDLGLETSHQVRYKGAFFRSFRHRSHFSIRIFYVNPRRPQITNNVDLKVKNTIRLPGKILQLFVMILRALYKLYCETILEVNNKRTFHYNLIVEAKSLERVIFSSSETRCSHETKSGKNGNHKLSS